MTDPTRDRPAEDDRAAMQVGDLSTGAELAPLPRPVLRPSTLETEPVPEGAPAGQWRLAWRKFRRHKIALFGLGVLALLALACLLAPWIAPHGYEDQNLSATFAKPGEEGYLLGTDSLGRDQLSRLLYGGRVSLAVGFGVALISGTFGTIVGAVAGFYGRFVDSLLMRATDAVLALPALVVLIVASKVLGGSIWDTVVVVSFVSWMPVARIVRGVFLSLREKEFVEAARAVGVRNHRIIFRHLLPNAMGPIVVNLTLTVAVAILAESALSFLGFGVQPPTPTWGNMLAKSKGFMTIASHLVWFPGLMILITVLSVNFVGDGLRDALDPTQRKVRE
jgi:peptide/nickel transport system permease protein